MDAVKDDLINGRLRLFVLISVRRGYCKIRFCLARFTGFPIFICNVVVLSSIDIAIIISYMQYKAYCSYSVFYSLTLSVLDNNNYVYLTFQYFCWLRYVGFICLCSNCITYSYCRFHCLLVPTTLYFLLTWWDNFCSVREYCSLLCLYGAATASTLTSYVQYCRHVIAYTVELST